MRRRLLWSAVVVGWVVATLAGCGGGRNEPTLPSAPTGTVEGRLVSTSSGRQGAVASRFTVHVHGAEDRIQWRAQVRTDGYFRIENVPAGEQTITIEDTQSHQGAVLVVFVRPGQVVNVGEVVPQPLGQIAGLVTDATTGKPIARARILARPVESEGETLSVLPSRPMFVSVTNAQGSYTLLVPEGTYLVEARHPNYEAAADTVVVQVGRTTSLDFQLTPRQDLGTVYGTVTAVVNGLQVPVPGALVALVPEGIVVPTDEMPPSPPEMTVGDVVKALQNPVKGAGQVPRKGRRPLFTFTKADGSYELTNVPAGSYRAIAMKPGYGKDEKVVTVEANQQVRVDFVLQANFGIVKGRVTDAETGQPIEGAVVVAVRKGDPWWIWDGWRPTPAEAGRPVWHRPKKERGGAMGRDIVPFPPLPPVIPPIRDGAITDRNGEYQLLLPPGDYFVTATADNYEWQAKEVDGLQAGQQVIVDFALRKFVNSWDNLEVTLSVPSSVRQGEPVPLLLTVRNVGNEPVHLEIALPEADFAVLTEEGEEVWRWSHGKAFPEVMQMITLQPGEARTYREVWRQVDNDGRPVPAGNYSVVGIFASTLEDEQSLTIIP